MDSDWGEAPAQANRHLLPLGPRSWRIHSRSFVALARALIARTNVEVSRRHYPTADQRALVENAAAFGITQADIAEQLKIDECVRLQRPEQRIGLGIA